jgi:hypothetical protein
MNISTHTILAVIAYFVVQHFFGTKFALIFAISSVIIDIDHWFWAVHKARKWWLHEAYFWNLKDVKRMKAYEDKGRKFAAVFHVFHTAEFILLTLAAGFFFPVIQPVSLGLVFHECCDLLEMSYTRTLHRRKWSVFQK